MTIHYAPATIADDEDELSFRQKVRSELANIAFCLEKIQSDFAAALANINMSISSGISMGSLFAPYDATVTYASTKVVSYGKIIYESNIDGNIGNTPSTNSIDYTAWIPGTATPWTKYATLGEWMKFTHSKIFAS